MTSRPRSIEAMVDEQIRRWELQRTLRKKNEISMPPPPAIVISRQPGAGGSSIAALVAETTGFSLWDREIVHAIAERSGVRESMLASLDERERGLLQQFLVTLRGHDEAMTAYAHHLAAVVHTVAQHGSAVIVGRGAQFIVDPKLALRVRVVAPREVRIARFASRTHLELEEAARRLERLEHERRTFARQHFGEDDRNLEHYDLLINTALLPPGAARDTIVAAYRGRFAELLAAQPTSV